VTDKSRLLQETVSAHTAPEEWSLDQPLIECQQTRSC
jgi:hypothetical protein